MSLSEILTQCRSENDKVIKEAENRLDQLGMADFGKLLEECSRILADESSVKENRQLCATLIKNMILFQAKHQGKWEQLNLELKFSIKNYVISCLASNVKEVRKAAAITVAGICKLEIPRGEWPDIINILIQTSANPDINIRMSSIITIGYISQELVPGNLSSEEVDNILSALINNLAADTDMEIISLAIVAFLNFLVFAKKNMEIPNERDVIFNVIFNCLNHHNVDIRVYSMQCLVEISRLYYDSLDSNIEKIIKLSEYHMRNDEEKVSIQAYEFWCSVSDEEVLRLNSGLPIRGYCEKAMIGLFDTMQVHLLNRNAEIERMNEDSWSNVKATSCLLHNLSQCTSNILIDKVFALIGQNLSSESPKSRDSVILAFGSVLATNHKQKIKEIIPGAVPTLLNMLSDKSYEVRTTVSWCLKKITEYHADCLMEMQLFDLFMATLINNLNSNKRVVVQLCDCIHYLAMNLKPDFKNGQSSGYMSKYMTELLAQLLQIAFTKEAYDPNQNVALAAFFCMGSLIDYAPFDTYSVINNFFTNIYSAFESTLDPKNFSKEEIRFAYQSYIATVISACAVGEKVKMNIEEAASVYNLIKQSFVQRQQVYEEGLMACSSLALALGDEFNSLIEDFAVYVLYGLRQWQDAAICRISINSTSDLLRGLGPLMNGYIDQIIPVILDILENQSSDKYLKTQSFIVLTDMFVYTREKALKHYDKIMSIIVTAFQAATWIQDKSDDVDLNEYFKSLREHLLESITCIIHCLKDLERMDLFDNHVINTLEFVDKIVDEKYEPTIDTYSGVLGVMGDLCEIYGVRMKEYINPQMISFLVEKMKASRILKYEKLAEWSTIVINKVLTN